MRKAGPECLPSRDSLPEGQAATEEEGAESTARSCPRLPAARTYLSLLCRPAPAGLPMAAGPGREREALGRRRVPQPRCGGGRAPGTGKRSRPCAGSSAAGREEGAASSSSPGRTAAAAPWKGL